MTSMLDFDLRTLLLPYDSMMATEIRAIGSKISAVVVVVVVVVVVLLLLLLSVRHQCHRVFSWHCFWRKSMIQSCSFAISDFSVVQFDIVCPIWCCSFLERGQQEGVHGMFIYNRYVLFGAGSAARACEVNCCIRPVHLLRVSLLRVLESNFPGDSL